MSDLDDTVVGAPVTAPATDPQTNGNGDGEQDEKATILAQLREERNEAASTRETYIDVPGYTALVARYKLIDMKAIDGIMRLSSRTSRDRADATIHGAMDVMIKANIGLYIRREDEFLGFEQLADGAGSTPIGFSNPKAAEILQCNVGDARENLLAIFGGNDVALLDHFNRLQRWMANTTRDVNEGFLGEA